MLRWTLLEIFSRRGFADILPFCGRKPLAVPPLAPGPATDRRRGDRRSR
jgi:hypothetical protein